MRRYPELLPSGVYVQRCPWRDTVIDHPIAEMVYDGHLHLSDRPGLGVDLVEEEMKKHPGITTDAPDNFYI